MNVPFPHCGPASAYWPGASSVGMVGIDGYFALPSDTCASVFGPIITQVRTDWRLDDNPAELAAFRAAVRKYR